MFVLPDFSPYIFKIGPIGPTWYGLMYVIGFVLGYLLAKRFARQTPNWQVEQVGDLLGYMLFGVILGGRIGYVLFYQFATFIDNPLYLFKIYEGGMSFHGGLLGVIVALALFAYKTRKPLLAVADFVAPLFPIGLFFGRIGNFLNSELWGKITDLPIGVVFPTGGELPRHPSQLYEAGLEGLLLFILLLIYRKTQPPMGHLSGLFLLGYGLSRFAIEFVRVPDAHLGYLALSWLTMGQVLTLPMILLGLFLLLRPAAKSL